MHDSNSAYVILVEDKHDTYSIDASDLGKAALTLLRERVDEDWYYDDDASGSMWLSTAMTILGAATENPESAGKAAWNFLKRRRDHEYEWVELQQVRDAR